MDYSGFVYIWYDTKRRWFYIGSHSGNINDGYVCSNTRLKNAYKKRPTTFRRRILEYVATDDRQLLLSAEQRWLDKISDNELMTGKNKVANTIRYYNVKKTASGGNGRKGSNGVLVGMKKYYDPETLKQTLCEEDKQPDGWVLGVPKTKTSTAKTVWIHNKAEVKNKRVITLTADLIDSGWEPGRLPTENLKAAMSKGGKTAIKKIDKSRPRRGKAVVTPLGAFAKLKDAAVAHKVTSTAVLARIKNINMPEWHYKENTRNGHTD